jgi:tetratricopeptide (TPR) repeat protein
VADGPDGEPRARMLQTVQAFARAALHEAGEWDEIRNAHASFYADLAGELSSRLEGPNALAARDRIEAELENMRVVLGWCLDQPADGPLPPAERLATGLRLCQALSWFWYAFGYTAEGHRWQRRAVAVASAAGGPDLAEALHGMAVLLLQQGETAEAKDALTTCLQIRRESGDRSKTAMELSSLGVACWTLGDLGTGRIMLRESIDIARQIGDQSRESTALSNLGAFEVGANNCEHAIELLERALAIDTRLGNVWGCAVIRSNLTAAMLRTGRADEAYASLRGQAADMAGLGDIELTIEIIELLASIFSQRGDAVRGEAARHRRSAARAGGHADPRPGRRATRRIPRTGTGPAERGPVGKGAPGRAHPQRAAGPGRGGRGRLANRAQPSPPPGAEPPPNHTHHPRSAHLAHNRGPYRSCYQREPTRLARL